MIPVFKGLRSRDACVKRMPEKEKHRYEPLIVKHSNVGESPVESSPLESNPLKHLAEKLSA